MAQRAEELGYYPEMILAGRRINNSMGKFVASECIKLLIKNDINIKTANALILGFTFKENCPDIRNTGVNSLRDEILNYGLDLDIYDPNANNDEVKNHYGFDLIDKIQNKYDLIILAVSHKEFFSLDIKTFQKKQRSFI